MQRIGLTGGIAAGKSVAARRFAELGAVVVDADQFARAAVAVGSAGLAAVVEEFGAQLLAPDGSLDRAALARVVFEDPTARRRLEAVVHPVVRRLAEACEAQAAADDPAAVVVHDIPLLVETGRAADFDLVVVVHAPAAQRAERLVGTRGMSSAEASGRIAAQVDDATRLAAADIVLDGTGTDAALVSQVDAVWARLAERRAGGGLRPAAGTV